MKKTTSATLGIGGLVTILVGTILLVPRNSRDPVNNHQNNKSIETILQEEKKPIVLEKSIEDENASNNSEETGYVHNEIKYVEIGEPLKPGEPIKPLILKKLGEETMEARFYFSDEINNIPQGLTKEQYYKELIKIPQKITLKSIFDFNNLGIVGRGVAYGLYKKTGSYLTKKEIINDFKEVSEELNRQFDEYTQEDTLAIENFLNLAGILDKYPKGSTISITSEGEVEHMRYISEDKNNISYALIGDSSAFKKFLEYRILQKNSDIQDGSYLNNQFKIYSEKTSQTSK